MTKINTQLLHLAKDKRLNKVISEVGVLKPGKINTDIYASLIKAIVSQQLSVKAADTIHKRFLTLFKNNYPDAKTVLNIDNELLRSSGLSYQKSGYIKNIAQFSLTEGLDYNFLKKKTDTELIEHLMKIKGVGRWTVEMLLMFSLNRKDVFPIDDLGIQNGIKKIYKLKSEKKELIKDIQKIAEKWQPYRTLACRYIWKFKDQKAVF
ncbi:MAG: DNA-3-methyladenine glycosylase [Bacteroidota bacterium]|nr:DNA-3-methyladenine glycosylase [Bacteroidota bacterium]